MPRQIYCPRRGPSVNEMPTSVPHRLHHTMAETRASSLSLSVCNMFVNIIILLQHDTCPVCRIPVSDRASESTAGLPSQNVFMSGGRNQYEQYDESSDMGSEEVN